LTPPADGIAFLAALVANFFCGAFPPLDLLAVCLVRAMVAVCCNDDGGKCYVFTSVQVMVVFICFASPSPFTHRYFCIFNIHHE
jgi:hypothetical protein